MRQILLTMIGVIASSLEHDVVREFFELFKTPWEFYQSDRQYEVILCAGDGDFDQDSGKSILIYGGQKLRVDTESNIAAAMKERRGSILTYKGSRIPIYGDCVTFAEGSNTLVDEGSRPAISKNQSHEKVVTRIGYDLFAEVRTLLTVGQPVPNAAIPSLELHIALLRDLILENGSTLFEIPAVPDGYRFIACLTHDVDHPSIRVHKFDHTILGFLYRAIFNSLFDAVRGRVPLRNLVTNWIAAMRLPLVHLGLAKDFWSEFDRYVEMEDGLPSSFFLIPFKDCSGRNCGGPVSSHRAARYGISDIKPQVRKLMSAGNEIGLHGIDAWLDASGARRELDQVRQVTGIRETGVRMHWLYFNEQSPAVLESAGASYDSTVGYNETIGYRAGTTQAFRPFGTTQLLELPLHIMDTSLFFPCYLNHSPREAHDQVGKIIDNAERFGGAITVNWHDRSIAPERLWGDFYLSLVEDLKNRGAWFATAGQAVSWYRKRRSASFDWSSDNPCVKAETSGEALPDLQLRVHYGRGAYETIPVATMASECTHEGDCKHTTVASS